LYSNRAICYISLEKWDAAERDATKSIELDNNFVKAYFRRGVSRKNLGKYWKAIDDFEHVLKLEPNNKEARDQLNSLDQTRLDSSLTKPKTKILIQEIDQSKNKGNIINNKTPKKITEIKQTETKKKFS